MSELQPLGENESEVRAWDRHFNVAHGSALVAARQAVYWCLENGQHPPDYGVEVVNTAAQAGVSTEATVVDIGCSFPWDLKLFQLAGHTGPLIGIDPNTKQFNGLPYWQPLGTDEEFGRLLDQNNEAEHGRFFRRFEGRPGTDEFEGITLIEARSHFLPLRSDSVDVEISNFSAQQWDKDKLLRSFQEIRRTLRSPRQYESMHAGYAQSETLADDRSSGFWQQAGLFIKMASGESNKSTTHDLEIAVSELASKLTGRKIYHPRPLQEGFTYEKGLKLLPHLFPQVYIKHYRGNIVFDSPGAKEIAMNAFRSNYDQYTDEAGNVIPEDIFEQALDEVVSKEIDNGIQTGNYVTDIMDRAQTVATEVDIHLDGFDRIGSR